MKALVAALVLWAAVICQAQEAPKAQLPSGDWTLSHQAYSRLGADAFPVRVMSVRGQAPQLEISAVSIRNQSRKTVNAVRISWYLTRQEAPNVILAGGTTASLALYGEAITAGGTLKSAIPVVSFTDLYRPFMDGGKLGGSFLIEVAVSEARYADGTSWKADGLPTTSR